MDEETPQPAPGPPPGWAPPWSDHGAPPLAPSAPAPAPPGQANYGTAELYGSASPVGAPPHPGDPYAGGPYGGGPYGGGPYGGGPYGGGPYGGWPPGRPPGARRAAAASVVAVGVLVAALVGGVVGHDFYSSSNVQVFNPGSSTTAPGAGAPANAASIAAAVSPGLVDINTQITNEGVLGAGTGMVLTSTGEVLTNNHVIEGANRISVTDIGNGKVYSATVVGYDRSHDIAVLQMQDASGLATVTTADSSKVALGQGVVAIGNANGTGGTPSYAAGTVTALDQTITASDEVDGSSEQLTGLIQTDADIVAGDSGGPLVNAAGHVVGIDTAASGGFQFANSGTQGYAIPINQALSIAHDITSGNASSTVHIGPTAFLGVGVRSGTTTQGAQIVQIIGSGPAAQAGLQVGDVITSLDGHTVTSAPALTQIMTGEKPGVSVTVLYVDTSGQAQSIRVVLANGPPQ